MNRWMHDQSRDWHAGARMARAVCRVATPAQVERLWQQARRHITSPDDAYAQGYVGTLAWTLDQVAPL